MWKAQRVRGTHGIVASLMLAVIGVWGAGCDDDGAADPGQPGGTGGALDGGPTGGAAAGGGSGGDCAADRCVELYERVEETLANDQVFADPFTDTELRVTVSAPAGRPPYGPADEWAVRVMLSIRAKAVLAVMRT